MIASTACTGTTARAVSRPPVKLPGSAVHAGHRRAGPPAGRSARPLPGTQHGTLPLAGQLANWPGTPGRARSRRSAGTRITRFDTAQPATKGDRIRVRSGGSACAGSTSGGSGTSRVRRITGGVTAGSGVASGRADGSGLCSEGTVLLCPGAASRRGLPYGGSTRFYGGSTRWQGHLGWVRGAAAAAQELRAVAGGCHHACRMMERSNAEAVVRSWLAAHSGYCRSSFPQVRHLDKSCDPVEPPLLACGMPTRTALVVLSWNGDGSPFR